MAMKGLKNLQKLAKLAPKAEQTPVVQPPENEQSKEDPGEHKFKKSEKYYVDKGPMLYVSKLLWKKGPLTCQQIWNSYLRDQQKPDPDLFRSKTFLKQQILHPMIKQNRIEKAGYDKDKKVFLGFRVVPQKAFYNVHPKILLSLDPLPQITRLNASDVLYYKEKFMRESSTSESK